MIDTTQLYRLRIVSKHPDPWPMSIGIIRVPVDNMFVIDYGNILIYTDYDRWLCSEPRIITTHNEIKKLKTKIKKWACKI